MYADFSTWSNARRTAHPYERSCDQWPSNVRRDVARLASQLRKHAAKLPIVYFAEWTDLWSPGDLFLRWLSPPDGDPPCHLYSDREELYAYSLPDGDLLKNLRENGPPADSQETQWFSTRLGEAIDAWTPLVGRATLVLIREVTGGPFVLDEEVNASMQSVPEWMKEKPAR